MIDFSQLQGTAADNRIHSQIGSGLHCAAGRGVQPDCIKAGETADLAGFQHQDALVHTAAFAGCVLAFTGEGGGGQIRAVHDHGDCTGEVAFVPAACTDSGDRHILA